MAGPLTGAERVPLELLRELVQLDRDSQYSLYLGEAAVSLVDFRAPNLTLRPYPDAWQKPVPNILWHQGRLPWLLRAHRVDVLFVAHNRVPLWKTCGQVALLHDLAEFHVGRKYDAARGLYRRLALGGGVRRADWVVTVSESAKADIQTFLNVPAHKIAVIPNALLAELGGASIDPLAARGFLTARYHLPAQYVLYVGALEHPNKNLVRLLEAFQLARERVGFPHHLVLVGPKRWRPEVVFNAIGRLGLEPCVHWLGYVPFADLRQLYAAADLFVYVSLWEGFGLPVLEAMAHGVPVIASNTSSLPEVAGEAAVLVEPTNTEEIAAAIGRVVTDQALQEHLRRAGPARANRFNWKSSAERLVGVFRAVHAEAERA